MRTIPKRFGLLVVLSILMLVVGCRKNENGGIDQSVSSSEMKHSSTLSENSSLETTILHGEITKQSRESFFIQLENEAEIEVPFHSFTEPSVEEKLEVGDILTLVFASELAIRNGRIDTEVESYSVESRISQVKAANILDEMSLEQKVGQMFLARVPDESKAEMAQNFELGGYLWFAKDFEGESPDSIQEATAAIQDAVSVPLFMAVDEEGGEVTRISSFPQFRSEPFSSPRQEYQLNGWDGIQSLEEEKADLLKELGMNMNLAPVADVPVQEDDFIFERSFSTNPDETAEYVQTVVTIFKDKRVGSVLKHFPGYGNNVDTHTGVAFDKRTYENFLQRDFLPFEAGIQAGTDAILVAHNVVSALDEEYPATLSPEVHRVIREDLDFQGIIMTDDLVMEGLTQFASTEEAAVLAVLAGNDLLCSTEYTVQIPAVIEAVKQGRIAVERIDESVMKILETKIQLEIVK